MLTDEQLMKEIIVDHYQNPRHSVLVDNSDYLTVRLKNPSCGDDLTIQVLFRHDSPHERIFIEDIRQSGSGCSICCASASMMAELCSAEEVTVVSDIVSNFSHMIQGETFDAELLGEAQALQGISKVIPRIKCANLAWQACSRAVEAALAAETANIEVEINE